MGERDVPLGINTTIGAVAVIVCCALPTDLTGPDIDARLAVLAVGVAAFAAAVVDVTAVAVTVAVGFLLFDGFVEGHQGDLVWHGRADVLRLAVLCATATAGLVVGAVNAWSEGRATAPESEALPAVPRPRGAVADVTAGEPGVGAVAACDVTAHDVAAPRRADARP